MRVGSAILLSSARARRRSRRRAVAAGGARSEGLRAGRRAVERRAKPRCRAGRVGLLGRCGGAAAEWRDGSRQGGHRGVLEAAVLDRVQRRGRRIERPVDVGRSRLRMGLGDVRGRRPAAQTVTDVTKYVNVLKKDASGSWKIAMTIWTSSRPR